MSNASYGLRPLPRRLRGRRKAWHRIEQVAAWVRRGAFVLMVGVVLYSAAFSPHNIRLR